MMLVALLACALACGQAGSGATRPRPANSSSSLLAPLPLPPDAGNGPAAKAVCCAANAFGGGDPLSQAETLVNGATALQVPATPATSISVASWPLGLPIDFSGGGSAGGLFSQNLDPGKIFGAQKNNWAGLFAGYLRVDPSATAQPIVKTFVVASDDGFRFAISDGTTAHTMSCDQNRSMSTTVAGTAYYAGCSSQFNQSKLTVTFPAAGGLFPFDLLYFNGNGSQGLEWSWADGSATPPTTSSLNGFTLVPADHVYAPAINTTMTVSDPNTTVHPGDTVTYSVSISNTGTAPLSSYTFAVRVDPTRLTNLTPSMGGSCSNNNGLLVCTMVQTLNPGDSLSGTFTAVVHAGLAANTIIDVQGVVTGLATATEIANAVGGAGEQTAGEIYALTGDPNSVGSSNFAAVDTGNTPAALASSAAVGLADDDATRLVVGAAAESAPVVTGPADPSWADVLLTISGTSRAPTGQTVQVSYSGPTNSSPLQSCTASTGTNGSWRCAAAAFGNGNYIARARIVGASGNVGPWGPDYPFVVNGPFAPVIITPSSGQVLNSSRVHFSGTAQQVANGETVRITVTPSSGPAITCDSSTLGDQWSCDRTLADGSYNVMAAVLEANGSPGSVAGPQPFTVVTGGACGSTMQQTASPSNNNQPTFHGTATAGLAVHVCAGGASPCGAGSTPLCAIATVDNSGVWQCHVASPLGDGSYTVVAVATNGAATVCPSNNDVFTIDTTPPAPPGFNAPASPTAQTSPGLSGTGIAGDTVQVGDGASGGFGNLLCSAVVESDGTWSCTSSALANGNFRLEAVQIDLAGNRSSATVQPLVVDNTQPDAPTLTGPGSPTRQNLIPFTGTADQSTNVVVYDGAGNLICGTDPVVAPSGSTGPWSCSSQSLPDGNYTFTAFARSSTTVLSPPSAPLAITIDTTAPGAPVLDAVPSPTAMHFPLFLGAAEAGAQVTVFEGQTPLCSGPSVGRFSCVSQSSLANGSHTVQANATDAVGNISAMSATVTFTIDDTIAPAPTLDPLATPTGGQPGFTAQTEPTFTGTGVPGDTVTVALVGAQTLCTATVRGDGTWSCASNVLLIGQPATPYSAHAVQQAPAGSHASSAPSAPISFTVDTRVPQAPSLNPPSTPTTNHSPTFTGSAEALDTVEVDDPGAGKLCSATADVQGHFSCTPTSPLATGDYQLTAQSTSRAGVQSAPSNPVQPLTVTTTNPNGLAAPTLDAPTSPTNNSRPTFTGTATAGIFINVRSNGRDFCTGTPANGHWTCQPFSSIPDGSYQITARAADLSGNVSPDSSPVSLVIDTVAPATPTIVTPADGSTLENAAVTASGTALVGLAVSLVLDGAAIGATSPGADGSWTLSLGTVSGGSHTLVANATDSLGNVSAPASVEFTIQVPGSVRGGCASGGVPMPLVAIALLLLAWPHRRARRLRRSFSPARIGALALLIATGAHAQQLDLGRFQPPSDGAGLLGVEGARAPIDGDPFVSANLWLDGAYEPLVFHPNTGGREVLVLDRIESFIGLEVHIWSRYSLAVQLPILLSESGDLSALPAAARPAGSFGSGLGDLRLTPRVSLLRQESAPIDLAVQGSLTLRTASNTAYVGDTRMQVELLAAAGRHLSLAGAQFELLGNLLLRLRTPQTILDVKQGNELGVRGGIAWLPEVSTSSVPRRVFVEAEAESALRGGFAPGTIPAEWRLGVSFCATEAISFDMGFGTALTSGVGSPRARLVLGLAYAPEACGAAARNRFARRPSVSVLSFAAPKAPERKPTSTADNAAEKSPQPAPVPPVANAAPASIISASANIAPAPLASTNAPAQASSAPTPHAPPAPDANAAPQSPVSATPQARPTPAPSNMLALPDANTLPLTSPPPRATTRDEALPLAPLVTTEITTRQVGISGNRLAIDGRIEFHSNEAGLERRSLALLQQVATLLKSHPELEHVEVRAHTGGAPSEEQAKSLSQQRADTVVKFLIGQGIEGARLTATGAGATQPIAPNLTAQGRKKNERVEFLLGK